MIAAQSIGVLDGVLDGVGVCEGVFVGEGVGEGVIVNICDTMGVPVMLCEIVGEPEGVGVGSICEGAGVIDAEVPDCVVEGVGVGVGVLARLLEAMIVGVMTAASSVPAEVSIAP